ncbi:MAG: polysaccharide biosynthesis tyrosine autokinase [Acidobacteriia bacterium]|nr:polysaccharide biosynthesis tyrosine autokinase [Terriglobia bacterium]
MSTYNMMERMPKSGPGGLAPRDNYAVAYPYSRMDLEMADGSMWRQALRAIRRHWKAALGFALIIEIALSLLVFSMANTYEADAVLDVEPPGGDIIGPNGPSSANPSNTPGYLDTQTEILGSDGLALSVINQLHLDQNQIFLKQTLLQKAIVWTARLLHGSGNANQQDQKKLIDIFHRGLSVEQVKGSQLVQVGYEAYDPQLAAQIVNTTVAQYLDKTYKSRYEATLRAAQSMSPQLSDLQNSVKKSTEDLLNFQKSHEGAQLGAASAVAGDGTTNAASAALDNPVAVRVSELNQQLTQAMGDRLQQESYMKQIQQGKVDSLPQMKDNVLIQGLTSRLVDSRAQLAQALAVYGSNNPQVRKLELESEEINKQLTAERNRIASQIQAAYSSAQNREQLTRNTLHGMKGELDQSNADVEQYDALKRTADSNANLYTTLSSRIKELAVSGSIKASNVLVLDDARPPVLPDGPHRVRILGIGAMFGVLGGVLLAFAAENMNDTISSAEDVRRWSGLPAIALVPKISTPGRGYGYLSQGRRQRAIASKSVTAMHAHSLQFLVDNPHSPEAEAIRNLETAIRIPGLSGEEVIKTVLITSALPGEGKTTIATNLALALARHGKTCLIDADFRRPSITPSFGLSQFAGLQDLLVSPENAMQRILKPHPDVPNLTVVGIGGRMPNGLETLTSARMAALLKTLREKFDYIVIDSPPVIPFAEGRWLSTHSDASIVVARCDSTTRGAINWSLEILDELKARVLGVVLNGVDLDAEFYSYGFKGYASYMAK